MVASLLLSFCRSSKEAGDQENLVSHLSLFHPLHLPFASHVHHFKSLSSLPLDTSARVDILTIAAIAIVTYFLSTLAHEALGHGLASVLVGLHVQRVTSVDLEVSFVGILAWKVRVVAVAGCLANLILAGLAMVLLRVTARKTPTTRFFCRITFLPEHLVQYLFIKRNMLLPLLLRSSLEDRIG